ncbi:MAG: OmpH family outer membrane protein [Nitrospirae bacterium]|nr:OmpH family outer membrane protein [Nitrospirota bacterium]
MKKIVVAIAVVFALSSLSWGADAKIGYVDLFKALNESQRGIDAKKSLEEVMKAKQESLDKTGKEIEQLQGELEKQASVLTPEAKKEKEDKKEKLVRDYQRSVKDAQEEIKKKEMQLTQEILKELRDIVNKIGESEGYTVIFEAQEGIILYIPQKFNLTDKVIKKYNETAKTKK